MRPSLRAHTAECISQFYANLFSHPPNRETRSRARETRRIGARWSGKIDGRTMAKHTRSTSPTVHCVRVFHHRLSFGDSTLDGKRLTGFAPRDPRAVRHPRLLSERMYLAPEHESRTESLLNVCKERIKPENLEKFKLDFAMEREVWG